LLRGGLSVLEAIGNYPQRQRLRCTQSLGARLPIRKDARKVSDLGDPPTVLLAVQLDGEAKAHQPQR